ncbi:unnamed protein product [Linum trigynum]|uniref:SHSP domain-containing protein n=1 Tax=Linum trigynum TaxID=586398 RepID=A0AAV2F822_9ROSI
MHFETNIKFRSDFDTKEFDAGLRYGLLTIEIPRSKSPSTATAESTQLAEPVAILLPPTVAKEEEGFVAEGKEESAATKEKGSPTDAEEEGLTTDTTKAKPAPTITDKEEAATTDQEIHVAVPCQAGGDYHCCPTTASKKEGPANVGIHQPSQDQPVIGGSAAGPAVESSTNAMKTPAPSSVGSARMQALAIRVQSLRGEVGGSENQWTRGFY